MKKTTAVMFCLVTTTVVYAQTNLLNSTGNVGIGTASPSFALGTSSSGVHIAGHSGTYATLNLQRLHNGEGSILDFSNASNTLQYRIGTNFSSGGDKLHFAYGASAVIGMTMDNSGNLGIGTSTPYSLLQLYGSAPIATIDNSTATGEAGLNINYAGYTKAIFTANMGTGEIRIGSYSSGYFPTFYSYGNEAMRISASGNLGIGTSSPSEKLSVNGNIIAKKIRVTQTGWSDYVFDNDYPLRSLASLEKYISTNSHLPELPSAKEVQEKGIDLGDTQALLLKKIEELTLYVIQQQKAINRQDKKIERQAMQIRKLMRR